jgi:hypothetical protein
MQTTSLRYIVFLIDSRFPKYYSNGAIECQDGAIFHTKQEAHKYATDAINENDCEKFVVGEFVMEMDAEVVGILQVESFGFKHDRKNANQLELFK